MEASRLVRSLTFRLALIYLALFTGSVALLLGGSYWTGVMAPLQAVQTSVADEADALVHVYGREDREAFVRRLRARAAAPAERAAYHALIDPGGAVIDTNLPNWPAPRAQRDWLRFEFETYASGDEVEHEAIARDVTFADGVRLLVGRDTEDLDEREDFIRETMAWGAGFTIAIGFAGGLLMSLAVGRRIEAVSSTARRVIHGNLSERVPVRGAGDDFDQLAETLNAMLARIEDLVQSVGRVSDSIAHELRTPLTRLRVALDELVAREGEAGERASLAAQALAEAERLQATFDALLRIARIETGRHAAALAEVDLAPVLLDAAELYQPLADEKGQDLVCEVEGRIPVRGDPNLLFQAVSNLLDNAIKYGPPGSRVTLKAESRDGGAAVTVRDEGAGVPPHLRPHITERFFRAPGAEATEGLGLGLSLAAAVARLHGGGLSFADARPGLAATLTLGR